MRHTSAVSGAKCNPLIPSARDQADHTKRGRNGGLFSSSSSSAGNSDASDGEHDRKHRMGSVPLLVGLPARCRPALMLSSSFSGSDSRRRTIFSTPSTSMSSSTFGGDNTHVSERKGLFEVDDDTGESLETFHERVKLRQRTKQSEMKALKAQLEAAQERAEEFEIRLNEVNQDKDAWTIRVKDCQRMIEKRNKQLVKASEKLTRYTEQYESQMTELQTQLAAMNAQYDQLQAHTATSEEKLKREREEKNQEVLREIELQSAKHEKLIKDAEWRFQEQRAANGALVLKVQEMEDKLTKSANQKPTTMEVVASEEYQSLLKRFEDAEAISRGLKFQLEKEQHEKKYLRKQLTALQETVGVKTAAETAASVGFLPDMPLVEPRGGVSNQEDTEAAIGSDTMLEMSDDKTGNGSISSSPTAVENTVSADLSTVTSDELSLSRSRSRNRSRGLSASNFTDDVSKPSLRDGKRRAASVQMFKSAMDTPVEDKSGDGKYAGMSATFFEKLSSRFKRSTSPRNGIKVTRNEVKIADGEAPIVSAFASSFERRQDVVHSKVSNERPRMYVARPPSYHEDESSDSIFGSESSASDLSDNDMPPLPPPPPTPVQETPYLVPVEALSQHIFSDDGDVSSLSDSDDDDDETHEWREALDKPTQLPTQFVTPLDQIGTTSLLPEVHRLPMSPSNKSYSSDDDNSDELDVEKSQPRHGKASKSSSLSESSSVSDSSFSDEEGETVTITNAVHMKVRKASLSGQERHDKRVPTLSNTREKNKSQSGADSIHSTSKSRMNEYMEDRARKRNEKLKLKQEKEHEETKKKEEYEKEWEIMAQEERERKRKQQQTRRNGRRRPASMKTVRVSQIRQQMNSKHQKEQREPSTSSPLYSNDPPRPREDEGVDVNGQASRHFRRKSECKTSESEAEEERQSDLRTLSTETPPLPPEPALADTELYLRQQARLRERHEMQMKKKLEADEADSVRGVIHRRVEMWAFGKELLHMILTLDQISSSNALKKCQLMVVQSPDNDTVRKAYRSIIRVVHPDKLRGATIPEQLEAKELFTVLNQAFEKFKSHST